MVEKTLPTLLAERAKKQRDVVALRQKYLGIWNELSWGEYLTNVEKLAIALSTQYRFQRGETLAIIGENRPQWLYAQMATQSLGGISVGIYQESSTEQIKYYLNDSKARIVIVEDQEQVDKLLEIEAHIPFVEAIIYYNNQGLRHYKHCKLESMDELLAIGAALLKEKHNFYEQCLSSLTGDTPAIIAYSAATSGPAKGAVLTHFNLIEAAKSLVEVDHLKNTQDYFSFLPLAWVHEQVVSIVVPLIVGMVVNFPEKPHTVIGDLREIGPQMVLAPPRVYQSLLSNFTLRMEGASWVKRKLFSFFKKYGDKRAKAVIDKKALSVVDKFLYTVGDALIFSAIRDHLGFARVERAYVAGAALQPDAFYFYHSLGINVKQTYGGTEVTGIAFVQRDDDIKIGSSGMPLPNTAVKIGEDGTVYLKNNAIFSAYLNETDRGTVMDGWISLGDKGYIDEDGHLFILDRQEDVIVNSEGVAVYPRLVENALKSSPFIQEVVCFGKNRPYMVALLNIDMTSVGRWADKNRIVYTEYSDLSRNAQVIELIVEEVKALMEDFPLNTQIKKFSILHKQFTADQGELTRTLKIRRNFVEEKYKHLLDAMYADQQEVSLSMEYSQVEPVKDISLRVVQLNHQQEVA